MANDDLHRGGGSRPVPDPTLLTTQQLNREIATLKEIIDTRLDAMDRAQAKFEANLEQVPLRAAADIDERIKQLQALITETFKTVDARFEAADAAVKAALAAAKEVISVEQRYGSDAIDKAEKATSKQLDQMGLLFRSSLSSLEGNIADIKQRVAIIESVKVGQTEQRAVSQGAQMQWVGILGLVLTAGVVFGGIVVAVTTNDGPAVSASPPFIIERQVSQAPSGNRVVIEPSQSEP